MVLLLLLVDAAVATTVATAVAAGVVAVAVAATTAAHAAAGAAAAAVAARAVGVQHCSDVVVSVDVVSYITVTSSLLLPMLFLRCL